MSLRSVCVKTTPLLPLRFKNYVPVIRVFCEIRGYPFPNPAFSTIRRRHNENYL